MAQDACVSGTSTVATDGCRIASDIDDVTFDLLILLPVKIVKANIFQPPLNPNMYC